MRVYLLLSAGLVLVSCNKRAPVTFESSSDKLSTLPDTTRFEAPRQLLGPEFVSTIAAADTFELTSARLALQASHSAKVTAFAQRVIADHASVDGALREAVNAADPTIPVNPALSNEQQSELAALRSASGETFDRMYADQQTTTHRRVTRVLESYAVSGDRPALKQFASRMVEMVRAHLAQLQTLRS